MADTEELYDAEPSAARSPALRSSRREFLQTSASLGCAGGLASLADLGALGELGCARKSQADVGPEFVRLSTDIEPIVRVLESTPRAQIFEAAAKLLRGGVGYRPFVAALYLAGIRNVDSRNSGSRFHCVYVIHAAHLLALDAPAHERFLPLFWALDDFKGAQASRPRPMGPLRARTPSGKNAIAALRDAVYSWDRDAAEVAAAGVARTCSAAEAFEELWRLGARDFRPIGHKAIFVTNAWRTLEIIGWQHAEPALRSLGQALAGNGAEFENGLRFEDECHRENDELVRAHAGELQADWAERLDSTSGADRAIAADLLAPMRRGDASSACRAALALLIGTEVRVSAGAIWDVVHLAAAELMLRRGDIGAVHAVTSANALHHAFRTARRSETRLFVLLQAVGWMAHFAFGMGFAACPDLAAGPSILDLALVDADADAEESDPAGAAESILESMASDRCATACKAFAFAHRHAGDPALFAAARHLVFSRATDPHDYKYPAAAFEDIASVSPAWRPHMVAASMLHIPAPTRPESQVVQRARESVKGIWW